MSFGKMGARGGFGSSGILGGARPWGPTLAKLRAALTATNGVTPHTQSVMASPPTVSATTSAPAGYALSQTYPSATALEYTGGRNKSGAGGARVFPVATQAASGGNVAGGENAVDWRIRTIHTGQKIAIRILGSAIPFRLIVNGQYSSLTGDLSATNTGLQYIAYDFGSSATREIIFEGEFAQGLLTVLYPTGESIALPTPSTLRGIALGDSFTTATGTTFAGDSYSRIFGEYLGIKDWSNSGLGGTGLIANGTGYNLTTRLAVDALNCGPWDMILIEMGTNDADTYANELAAANSVLNSLRTTFPAALIFVAGVWNPSAPGAQAAQKVINNTAIHDACAGRGGVWFFDPTNVAYTLNGTPHPDTAGHFTLGTWLWNQVKTTFGW